MLEDGAGDEVGVGAQKPMQGTETGVGSRTGVWVETSCSCLALDSAWIEWCGGSKLFSTAYLQRAIDKIW